MDLLEDHDVPAFIGIHGFGLEIDRVAVVGQLHGSTRTAARLFAGHKGLFFLSQAHAVIVARHIFEGVDQPEITTTLREEEFVVIAVVPVAPLLGRFETAEGIAFQNRLGDILFRVILLEHRDALVEDADVIVRDAQVADFVVDGQAVGVFRAPEPAEVLVVIILVGLFIGTEDLVEALATVGLHQILPVGDQFLRREILIDGHVGIDFLAFGLHLPDDVLEAVHRPVELLVGAVHVLPHLARHPVLVHTDVVAGGHAVVELPGDGMLAGKLFHIDDGIDEERLGRIGHIGRGSREAPGEPVGVAAERHGVDALGAFAAADDLGLRRIGVAARAGDHAYAVVVAVGQLVRIVDGLHREHLGLGGELFTHVFGHFERGGRRGLHARLELDFHRALENGMRGVPAEGPVFQAEAVPVVLGADATAHLLAGLGDGDHRPVEVEREILRTGITDHPPVLIHFADTRCDGGRRTVDDGHVVVVGHRVVIVLGIDDLDRLEMLLEEFFEGGGPFGRALGHDGRIGRRTDSDGLDFRRSADIEHAHRLLFLGVEAQKTAEQQGKGQE